MTYDITTINGLVGKTLRDLGQAVVVDTSGHYAPNTLVTVTPASRAGATVVIDTGLPADVRGGCGFPGEVLHGAGYRGAPLLRHRLAVGDHDLFEVTMTTKGVVKAAYALTPAASITTFADGEVFSAWRRAAMVAREAEAAAA